MLGAGSRRFRRSNTRRDRATESIVCLSERERVASVIKMAKEKLKPFATAEYPWNGALAPNKPMPQEYIKLGMGDGVGVMLKMAILEVSDDGVVTDEVLAKFEV